MFFSDEQINEFILEKKSPLTPLLPMPKLNPRRGHAVKDIPLNGSNGTNFVVKLRRSAFDILDFSVILAVVDPQSNTHFRLRRYNGNSHPHTNKLEGLRVDYKFHIHQATERYQNSRADEDGFAEESDRYSSMETAIKCLIKDCNIDDPSINGQMEIWDAPQNSN